MSCTLEMYPPPPNFQLTSVSVDRMTLPGNCRKPTARSVGYRFPLIVRLQRHYVLKRMFRCVIGSCSDHRTIGVGYDSALMAQQVTDRDDVSFVRKLRDVIADIVGKPELLLTV